MDVPFLAHIFPLYRGLSQNTKKKSSWAVTVDLGALGP
jgi:hypothetical protein